MPPKKSQFNWVVDDDFSQELTKLFEIDNSSHGDELSTTLAEKDSNLAIPMLTPSMYRRCGNNVAQLPTRSPIRSPFLSPIRSPIMSPILSLFRSPILSPIRSPIWSLFRSTILSPFRSPILSPIRNVDEEAVVPGPDDLQERRGFFQSISGALTSTGISFGMALCKLFDPSIDRTRRQHVLFYSSLSLDTVALALGLLAVQLFFTLPSQGSARSLSWAAMVTQTSLVIEGIASIVGFSVILPATPAYIVVGISMFYAMCAIVLYATRHHY